jgi:HAE1 family hydrophobic/amphiphilic exporter-1
VDLLTRFSLKNAAVIIMAAIMVVVGGLYSASMLKKETMPDISIPIVAVITPYPGAAPADVHDKVTQPIERAIKQIEGLNTVQSTSSDSVSVVVAEFSYSSNMDEAETAINEALKTLDLPDNVMDSTTKRVSMGSQPILKFAVSGGESPEELQAAVRDIVIPALESVDGVGEVNSSADTAEAIVIKFKNKALADKGLTESTVIQQLQATNLSFPIGSVEIDSVDNPIRVGGSITSIEDLEELQIAIYPNVNEMYANAFQQMGEGMGALGSAVGQLGGAVGQLGGAVGSIGTGMGEMAQGLGMQSGLVAAMQDVQAQLLDAKIQVTAAKSLMRDLESAGTTMTPEYMGAEATVEALEGQAIPGLTAALDGIKAQLAALQSSAANAPQASVPNMSAPSGSMPSASGDMEMAEPTIELVSLGELADISYDDGSSSSLSRAAGKTAVLFDIVKTQEANTVDTAEGVREALESVRSQLPADAEVNYTYDGSVIIEDSVSDMVREGLLGALFAFMIILLFLRNWRATIISAVSIPLSVIIALLAMKAVGVTMNIMTLGGLTVAIGRVVDDSIVVIENIFNHIQAGAERTPAMIRAATAEVSGAITSSTITTMAVFAPMALVEGIVGKIFTPFALTVAVALAASLLVSVTVVPLLAKWSLLDSKVPARDEGNTRSGKAYRKTLEWALGHKGAVMAGAALLLVGALALVPVIGTGFMSSMSEPYIQIDLEYPAGYNANDVDAALKKIEVGLAKDADVTFYTTSVSTAGGFNMAGGGVISGNRGTAFVGFKSDTDMEDAGKRMHAIADPLAVDGAEVKVGEISSMGGSANSVDLVVTGPTMESIAKAAEQIETAIEGVDGLQNVSSNLSETRPQITVDVDQVKAAEVGLNAAMVAGMVRGYVAEQSAGFIEMDGRETELRYITHLGDVSSAKTIADHKLTTPLGDEIRIGDIAKVESIETPVSVLTRDERQYASVSAAVTVRDTSTVVTAVDDIVAELDLPEGVEVESEGIASMMNESFKQLGIAMIIAIAAVYLVMVLTFGEAIAPLAIMFSLPLAIIGGIVGLFITGLPLDMPAMIGALMLIGLVTTNAIMFIERVNQKRAEGLSRHDSLLDAGTNRMRPILMTALTTIMALIPMASGMASGAMSSQSLAIIVVGGLTTSTALTLIVVPVVYDLLESMKERILRVPSNDQDAEAAA